MRIAIDLGFGFDKVMNEHGTKKEYPALCKRRLISTPIGLTEIEDEYCVTLEDINDSSKRDSFYIGDAAFANGCKRKLQDKDDIDNMELKVRVATAIALVNTKGEPTQLCVGLPISYFNQKAAALSTALQDLDTYIYFGEKRVPIQIENAAIFLQGLGAYYSALYNIDGTTKKDAPVNDEIGLIDIGYRTVDYILMGRGRKGIKCLSEFSGSLEEGGMYNVYDRIGKYILEKFKCEVPIEEIEKSILWNESILNFKGETLNISPFEYSAYEEVAKEIIGQINIKWKEKRNILGAIYSTGGGGEKIYSNLSELMPNIRCQEDATFANCRGYLALQALKQKEDLKAKI